MNEERVRELVREELKKNFKKERWIFPTTLQFLDGRNIQTGRATGTKVATATDQKLGFYGVTPVDQPDTVSDPAGQVSDLDEEARNAIDAIIDRLQELGLIA